MFWGVFFISRLLHQGNIPKWVLNWTSLQQASKPLLAKKLLEGEGTG
jgi:hypothetical protein